MGGLLYFIGINPTHFHVNFNRFIQLTSIMKNMKFQCDRCGADMLICADTHS